MSEKIQCKNIHSQHPGNQGEAIDPWIKSSNIQPIKLRSIGHVTPKQEGDEAQVSSGQSMAQHGNDGAPVFGINTKRRSCPLICLFVQVFSGQNIPDTRLGSVSNPQSLYIKVADCYGRRCKQEKGELLFLCL